MKRKFFIFFVLFSTYSYATDTLSIIKSISSSSELIEDGLNNFDYSIANILDNDLTTAWFEGEDESQQPNREPFGFGYSVDLYFHKIENLDSIEIANGYGKSDKHFKENGRLYKILLTFDTGKKEFTLDDEMDFQKLTLGGVKTKSLSIKVLEAKKGSRYDDVGFSEIRLNVKPKIKSPIYSNELSNIKMQLDNYLGYGSKDIPDLSDLSTDEFLLILGKNFKEISGTGAEDRTLSVIKLVEKSKNSSHLIPSLLKKRKNSSLLINYAENDLVDLYLEKYLIKNLQLKIAYLNSVKLDNYNVYYRLIDLGDMRAITGIFEMYSKFPVLPEYYATKTPYELLKRYKGAKLTKIILEYKDKLDPHVWKEVERLL